MLITGLTACGAPGLTTAFLDLALNHPGPALLIEASRSGPSLKPDRFHKSTTVVQILRQNMGQNEAVLSSLWDLALHIDDSGNTRYLAGQDTPTRHLPTAFWEHIADAAGSVGLLVLLDLGRFDPTLTTDPRWAALRASDSVIAVSDSSAGGVLNTANVIHALAKHSVFETRICLAVQGPGRPYSLQEIQQHCHTTTPGVHVVALPHSTSSVARLHTRKPKKPITASLSNHLNLENP